MTTSRVSAEIYTMNLTNCPVCRRVKGFDDLTCKTCWERVSEQDRSRHAHFVLGGERDEGRLSALDQYIISTLKETLAAGKPFGYDVEIECWAMPMRRTFHWQGSENSARRRAALQSTFRRIVSIAPLTKAEWVRAYGLGKM